MALIIYYAKTELTKKEAAKFLGPTEQKKDSRAASRRPKAG